MALGMACIVFAAIPRAESGACGERDAEPTQRVVGFSDEVQLGEVGAISEVAEEIMEVYVEDTLTHQPLELADEPLFRGKVLTTYANRKWKQPLFHGKSLQPPRLPPKDTPTVRQRFVVQPLDTSVLFSMAPFYSPAKRDNILLSDDGEQIQMMPHERRRSALRRNSLRPAHHRRRWNRHMSTLVQANAPWTNKLESIDDLARRAGWR